MGWKWSLDTHHWERSRPRPGIPSLPPQFLPEAGVELDDMRWPQYGASKNTDCIGSSLVKGGGFSPRPCSPEPHFISQQPSVWALLMSKPTLGLYPLLYPEPKWGKDFIYATPPFFFSPFPSCRRFGTRRNTVHLLAGVSKQWLSISRYKSPFVENDGSTCLLRVIIKISIRELTAGIMWIKWFKIKGIYLVVSLVSRPYVGQAPLFTVETAPDVFLYFFLLIQGARGGGIHKHKAKVHHILFIC